MDSPTLKTSDNVFFPYDPPYSRGNVVHLNKKNYAIRKLHKTKNFALNNQNQIEKTNYRELARSAQSDSVFYLT